MAEFLQEGIDEYKAGRKDKAREIFRQIVKEHPNYTKAWEWLLQTSKDDYERLSILDKILGINPTHEVAKKLHAELTKKLRQPVSKIAPAKPKAIPPSPQKTVSKANKNLIIFTTTILLLCSLCFCIYSFSDTPTNNTDHKTMAYIICQLYVEDNLKAPSTADFPPSSQVNIRKLENNIYEMTSYVDAQNGFGAMIRTDYYCKVQYTGTPQDDDSNGALWKLLEFEFYE